MTNSTVVFTIAARNYLGVASVLKTSVLAHCREIDFRCFVVDGFDSVEEIPGALRSCVTDCRNLEIRNFEEMSFKYDVVEFSTALKPHIFMSLFGQGVARAIYLDPDIKLYDGLNWLQDELNTHSIVVTPHLLSVTANDPLCAKATPALDLPVYLYAGDFNLGFIAAKNDAHAKSFIAWWANVLSIYCFLDPRRGLCVDQKWVNMVTGFFDQQLLILRDPGANLAFWNLHEREITKELGNVHYVNGSQLKFIHYSNVDLGRDAVQGNVIAKGKIDSSLYPVFAALYSEYLHEAIQAGHRERKRDMPYRFNCFEDGISINKLHRRLFAVLSQQTKYSKPFSQSGSYYLLLKRSGLLDKRFRASNVSAADISDVTKKRRIFELLFYALFKIIGVKYYLAFLGELRRIAELENNTFLLRTKHRLKS